MDTLFFPLHFWSPCYCFTLHQLLLVQALRPDRLQSAMTAFASQALGKWYLLFILYLFSNSPCILSLL